MKKSSKRDTRKQASTIKHLEILSQTAETMFPHWKNVHCSSKRCLVFYADRAFLYAATSKLVSPAKSNPVWMLFSTDLVDSLYFTDISDLNSRGDPYA